MEDNRLKRVFDQVKLSPEREGAMLADLLHEKKEVSSMKQTTKRRIPAAALVAAALVAVLAGTAVAVGYSGRLDVTPVDGDFENGYNVRGAYQNIPPERLSTELLERAERIGGGSEELIFGSWSEAEEFIGLEIADNPMLEEMAQSEWTPLHDGDATPEDMRRCTAHMSYSMGLPNKIWLHADYFGDYFEEGTFGVNVLAYMCVKAEGRNDRPFTVGHTNGQNLEVEEYTTPSGLEVTIVSGEYPCVRAYDGATFQQHAYMAYFSLRSVMFELWTNYNEDTAESSLRLLKQVLDAYE